MGGKTSQDGDRKDIKGACSMSERFRSGSSLSYSFLAVNTKETVDVLQYVLYQ